MLFFNPRYIDQHVVEVNLNLTNPYNSTTHQYQANDSYLTYDRYDHLNNDPEVTCDDSEYLINIENKEGKGVNTTKAQQINITFLIKS